MASVAILIDGGFLKHKFKDATKRHLNANDVIECAKKIMDSDELKKDTLFRIYYYDCKPYDKQITHPLSGVKTDCQNTSASIAIRSFLKELSKKPRVALREGILSFKGWKIDNNKVASIVEGVRTTGKHDPSDFIPDFKQKGVDIKIGLDIAWLSSKRIVEKIVLVSGDSDFIPAMKFARREGITVHLTHINHAVNEDMIVHCDGVVDLVI